MSEEQMRAAVFVDRDGTLIKEVNFLSRVEDLCFFDFTAEAVERLKSAGFLVIVITNQSGIGRGVFDEAAMHAIHDEIQQLLPEPVDGFYFCPHLPGAGCRCRKPSSGLIEDACSDFDIDLSRSWMVGDKTLDVEAGHNAGIRTAMVMTGYGRSQLGDLARRPDIIAENLSIAADQIIKQASENLAFTGPEVSR